MGRERRIWSTLLTYVWIVCGCMTDTEVQQFAEVQVKISGTGFTTRAADPDETAVNDLNVYVFDSRGIMEEQIWIPKVTDSRSPNCAITLLKGKDYSFYACANLGRRHELSSVSGLEELRCYLAYPDDYREGMPMAGKAEGIRIEDGQTEVRIALERLMAKISITMDRGGLSGDVSMNVTHVRIGNCPKTARVFTENRVADHDECFSTGFSRNEVECSILNRNAGNGISGTLTLYMLENMQGDIGNITSDSHKVFSEYDVRRETCSYIEIWLDYRSPSLASSDIPLKYRFYLGESRSNLDVERNCHYHITVIPEDDGLSDEGWRVDKSGLEPCPDGTFFSMSPSGYIQTDIGDTLHVRCSFHPLDTDFEIGREELEFDKSRGIYDYEIDPDGRGVCLYLKAPGTGIIYMSAGAPVNQSGMLVVEVNNIKNSIS